MRAPVQEVASRKRFAAGLSRALEDLPGPVAIDKVDVEPEQRGGTARELDLIIHLTLKGQRVALLVEVKKTAYPRDVKVALERLERVVSVPPRGRAGEVAVPFFVTEALSPGARALLRERNIGYHDAGGSLFIPAEGAYVFIDRPPPAKDPSASVEVFRRKSVRIVHAALTNPREWFNANEIAERVRVAVSTASRTLIALENMGFASSRGKGRMKERTIPDRGALLDAWEHFVLASRPPVLQKYFVPAASGSRELLSKIASGFPSAIDFAVTGEAAGQRYAPYLTSESGVVRVRAVASSLLAAAIASIGGRPVDEGFNLGVIEVEEPADLFRGEQIDKVPLASPIQVYLDLLRGEGRAKDLAEHLRREKIGF
jgi:hypothetical protein